MFIYVVRKAIELGMQGCWGWHCYHAAETVYHNWTAVAQGDLNAQTLSAVIILIEAGRHLANKAIGNPGPVEPKQVDLPVERDINDEE